MNLRTLCGIPGWWIVIIVLSVPSSSRTIIGDSGNDNFRSSNLQNNIEVKPDDAHKSLRFLQEVNPFSGHAIGIYLQSQNSFLFADMQTDVISVLAHLDCSQSSRQLLVFKRFVDQSTTNSGRGFNANFQSGQSFVAASLDRLGQQYKLQFNTDTATEQGFSDWYFAIEKSMACTMNFMMTDGSIEEESKKFTKLSNIHFEEFSFKVTKRLSRNKLCVGVGHRIQWGEHIQLVSGHFSNGAEFQNYALICNGKHEIETEETLIVSARIDRDVLVVRVLKFESQMSHELQIQVDDVGLHAYFEYINYDPQPLEHSIGFLYEADDLYEVKFNFLIDECEEEPGICDYMSEYCQDFDDGYECVCHPGYGHKHGDKKVCEDIDECAMEDNYCGEAHCINELGSFSCNCEKGFTFWSGKCVKKRIAALVSSLLGVMVATAALIAGVCFWLRFFNPNKETLVLVRASRPFTQID